MGWTRARVIHLQGESNGGISALSQTRKTWAGHPRCFLFLVAFDYERCDVPPLVTAMEAIGKGLTLRQDIRRPEMGALGDDSHQRSASTRDSKTNC